jgi:glycosyltransferase involved in cell wall biosynthesis
MKTGGLRVIFDYANKLNEKGNEVVVYYTLIPYNQKKKTRLKERIRQMMNKFSFLRLQKKIIKGFGDIKFRFKLIPFVSNLFLPDADAILFSYWPIAFKVQNLKSSKGKILYLIQAYEYWESDLDLLNSTYKMGFNNITVSDELRKKVYEVSGADSVVINNGIDLSKFYNYEKIFNKKKKIVSFVYYNLEFKGVQEILEVVDRIHSSYENVEFRCFSFLKPENLPDYISFITNPDDEKIREIYCDSDIFICASKEEGFYLLPVEAMACKCAVVTSRVGAVPDFSVHKLDSMHFTPGNIDEMESCVRYLLDNPGELEKISMNGYQNIRKKLNLEKSVALIEDLIRNAR